MNITPVSTNQNVSLSPFSNNNIIKILEKQKMKIQDQIHETNESKMDDKAKQERIKQLQAQIQQIDMEIQQKQNERLNQKANQQTTSSQSNTADNGDSSNIDGISRLIKASTTYSQLEIMNNTKKSLNGKGNVLAIEIKLDEKRGGEAKAKRAELEEIKSREQILNKKVGKTIQDVQNQVEKASKAECENNDLNNEVKDGTAIDAQSTIAPEENSQQQKIKGMDKNYKKVDANV